MNDRAQEQTAPTVVIKVGTSSLINESLKALNLVSLARICETVRRLQDEGYHVCIVSSGAVGVGCQVLRLSERPDKQAQRQALASIGQGVLIGRYIDCFSALSMTCSQVLITGESLSSKRQCTLAKQTFTELFRYGVVPIVNENDTINVKELRIGDNDTLSAQVAALISADWLVLLTDVEYLYTANPKLDPSAEPIKVVRDISTLEVDTGTAGSQWGTGGMATKLTAARLACAAGCSMAICTSEEPERVLKLVLYGADCGTIFLPLGSEVADRKRWLLTVPVRGTLTVDAGCARALLQKKNLYGAGILDCDGDFLELDAIEMVCMGRTIARGLTNFNATDMHQVKGKASSCYPDDIRIRGVDEVMYRDNIALLQESLPEIE